MARVNVVGKHLLQVRINHDSESHFDDYTPYFAAHFSDLTCSCEM
jgi:hypothetical protein